MEHSTARPTHGAMRDAVGRQYVIDTQTGTVGVLMATSYGKAYVRPVHGGPEWAVAPARLRPATASEIEAHR